MRAYNPQRASTQLPSCGLLVDTSAAIHCNLRQAMALGMSVAKHILERDYPGSEKLLTEALSKTKWQLNEPARHYFSILYNRACAQARLGETDSALSDLKKAIPPANPSDALMKDQFLADIRLLKKGFQQDIEAPTAQNPLGGDLYTISKDRPQRLQEIAERLKQH